MAMSDSGWNRGLMEDGKDYRNPFLRRMRVNTIDEFIIPCKLPEDK
jgi:hypothetical protein